MNKKAWFHHTVREFNAQELQSHPELLSFLTFLLVYNRELLLRLSSLQKHNFNPEVALYCLDTTVKSKVVTHAQNAYRCGATLDYLDAHIIITWGAHIEKASSWIAADFATENNCSASDVYKITIKHPKFLDDVLERTYADAIDWVNTSFLFDRSKIPHFATLSSLVKIHFTRDVLKIYALSRSVKNVKKRKE